MKKIFLLICCFCLIGCEKNDSNKELLIGEWTYRTTELGEKRLFNFVFYDNNVFEFSKCFYRSYDESCANGEAEWSGTYSLNDNRIKLKIKEENQIIDRYDSSIIDPPSNLIIDFENMYMCDANEGLDCSEKYEKDI